MFSFQLLVVIEYTISKLTSVEVSLTLELETPTEVGLIKKSQYIEN